MSQRLGTGDQNLLKTPGYIPGPRPGQTCREMGNHLNFVLRQLGDEEYRFNNQGLLEFWPVTSGKAFEFSVHKMGITVSILQCSVNSSH